MLCVDLMVEHLKFIPRKLQKEIQNKTHVVVLFSNESKHFYWLDRLPHAIEETIFV